MPVLFLFQYPSPDPRASAFLRVWLTHSPIYKVSCTQLARPKYLSPSPKYLDPRKDPSLPLRSSHRPHLLPGVSQVPPRRALELAEAACSGDSLQPFSWAAGPALRAQLRARGCPGRARSLPTAPARRYLHVLQVPLRSSAPARGPAVLVPPAPLAPAAARAGQVGGPVCCYRDCPGDGEGGGGGKGDGEEGGGGWGRRMGEEGEGGEQGREAGHQGLNLDTNLNRYCPFPGQDWSEGATTPLMCPNMGWDSRRAPLPPEVSPEPGSFQGFSPSHRPLLLSHAFSRFLALNVRVILSFLLSPLFSISFFCLHPYCFLSFASYLVFLGGPG